jgi:hypothetical protein
MIARLGTEIQNSRFLFFFCEEIKLMIGLSTRNTRNILGLRYFYRLYIHCRCIYCVCDKKRCFGHVGETIKFYVLSYVAHFFLGTQSYTRVCRHDAHKYAHIIHASMQVSISYTQVCECMLTNTSWGNSIKLQYQSSYCCPQHSLIPDPFGSVIFLQALWTFQSDSKVMLT